LNQDHAIVITWSPENYSGGTTQPLPRDGGAWRRGGTPQSPTLSASLPTESRLQIIGWTHFIAAHFMVYHCKILC